MQKGEQGLHKDNAHKKYKQKKRRKSEQIELPPPILKTTACKMLVKSKKAALKSEMSDALSDGFLLRCRYLPSS